MLVVNAVGDDRAFEVDNNDGWLLAADGTESALEHGSKTLMASRIVDAIVAFLHAVASRANACCVKGCAQPSTAWVHEAHAMELQGADVARV